MFTEMVYRQRLLGKPRWRRPTSLMRKGKRPPRVKRNPRLPGLLPTLLTLGNGVCGLGSIVVATGALVDVSVAQATLFAALLIFLGMLFDMLDGQVARGLKQTSAFGAQLDSLCDAVTFGAAPVFILLAFSSVFQPRFLFGVGAVYFACVLLRLARFNVESSDTDSHDEFTGLPSPAAAGTIASFALAMPELEGWMDPSMPLRVQQLGATLINGVMIGLPLLTLVLAWLMVSRVSYQHIVNRWVGRRYRFNQLSRVVIVISAALVVHEVALPLAFCLFALGPASDALRKEFRGDKRSSAEDSAAPPCSSGEPVQLEVPCRDIGN